LTLAITGTVFSGVVPSLNVQPNAIASISLCDLSSKILTVIPDITVDQSFSAYFIAKDKFANKIQLNSASSLSAIFNRGTVSQ